MRSLCRRLRLHPYLMVFVANLLVALVSFCPFILRGKGLFTLCADFNSQELAFNMLCNSAIKSGDVLWNWGLDIGSDLVSSMSFYNLGSPFFWLSLIFPASVFPWLIGWNLYAQICRCRVDLLPVFSALCQPPERFSRLDAVRLFRISMLQSAVLPFS